MLDKLLNLIDRYSNIEFSYKHSYLICYGEGYEIASINSYQYLRDVYLELSEHDFLHVSIEDFITSNKELKKIIKRHKLGFIHSLFARTKFFRQPIFNSYELFNDKDFFNFFENKGAYLDLDIHIMTKNGFIDRFFYIVEEELGTGEDGSDIVGEELYDEINKTLFGKKTYTSEIEVSYIFNDFINSNNRYVYFLLKELESNRHLKITNICIKEGKIKFIISDLTEIKKELFTNNGNEILNENLEIEYIITNKGCDLIKGELLATFIKTEKPFKIIERIYKNKTGKKKSINLSSLHKLLYGESYERSIHEDHLEKIKNIVKGINKKVKPLNNGKPIISFKGQVLEEL